MKIINWLWVILMIVLTIHAWVLFPITVPVIILNLSEALGKEDTH